MFRFGFWCFLMGINATNIVRDEVRGNVDWTTYCAYVGLIFSFFCALITRAVLDLKATKGEFE